MALAAAAGLHAVVLTALAWPVIEIFPDRSNDENAIDVVLQRARRVTAAAAPSSPAPRARPATSAPAPADPLGLAPVATAPPNPATTSYATTGPGRPGTDLRALLRGSGLGCANSHGLGLDREARDRCAERLGAQARDAQPLPAPIDPGKRAYYDAVAEAYRDPGQMVPLTTRGAGGLFKEERSVFPGHGPRVGCSVKFGANADKSPKGPPNALRAGPCFLQAPTGSLTPEGDIRKPY
ncbi:hypothetical protein BH10PSE4_BH10PSE4_47620 [soil metagenome]